MAILPVQLARVSNLLQASTTTGQIATTQQSLLQVENQLSTGKRVNSPSDDPAAASMIQELQKTLDTRQAYSTNLTQASSQLGEVDTTLGSLTDILQQAETIASANVGSDVTAQQRQGAAAIVQNLYNQALSIGNTQFEGSYIFGGTKSTTPPFVDSNGTVQFTGSTKLLQNEVDTGALRAFQVDGNQVFGALSTRVQGATNLSPSIDATTRLSDLGGAQNDGVALGSIQVSNGSTSKIIDLTKADTVGDVVAAINAAGVPGITAVVGSTGINLVPGGSENISVTEVGGGGPAASLGLTSAPGGPGVPVTGESLNTRVTPLTPLADLRGGAGLDLSGLTINNGAASATIDLTGATTVEDVLNAVNGSKTGVLARINAAGDGIDIVNSTQGTNLTIAENGGQTAEQLGVRSFSPGTPLSQLNGGTGVRSVTGGDFQVTRKDGTSFSVSITGASTVQDVIDDINTADGGAGVTASFATTGNGIVLTDTTGGGGNLAVTSENSSSAAADLGILQSSSTGTLTGTDVNAVQASGVLANLAKLRDSLQGSDPAGITASAQGIQSDYNRVVGIRGANGAQVQEELQSRQSKLDDENVATQSLLSNLQDTDFTTEITQFQTLQTQLQANYEVAAKTLNESLLDFLG